MAAAIIAGQSIIGQSGNDLEPVDFDPVLVTASPFVERKAKLVVPASELPGDALLRSTESYLEGTLAGQTGVLSTYCAKEWAS